MKRLALVMALLCALFAVRDRGVFRVRPAHLKYFFGTGVVSVLLFTVCYFSCQQICSLAVASILLYTAPAIVVALSSNKSSADFQMEEQVGKPLYQVVMEKMMSISTPDNMMFVVGATKADKLAEIRKFCPDNFFLVPGVGAQGGSAEEVIAHGANARGGLLINSSRGIIYASNGEDFAEAAAHAAAVTANI